MTIADQLTLLGNTKAAIKAAIEDKGVTVGTGSPDETLSAAAYRTEHQGKFLGKVFRPVIDFLFSLFEKHHCLHAFQSEKDRKHLPAEYS